MNNIKIIPFIAAAGIMLTATMANAGDAEKGKKVAKKCTACHTLEEGGKHRLGPNLFGILNKTAGQATGYKYSKDMMSSGITWDPTTFLEFVTKPKRVLKNTKMSFRGIKSADQRADLLAYFKTLGAQEGVDLSHGDPVAGKRAAEKNCVVCHSFEKGGKVVYGPNLFDIAGKPAAAIEGYNYSPALKASGLTWTDKNLAGFVANPEQFVKGTRARFPGVRSVKDQADILAYIKSLK
ncbi:MAG: c-type cytochrome [Rhizobiaceae bacterium]